jgi:hypothetical protein
MSRIFYDWTSKYPQPKYNDEQFHRLIAACVEVWSRQMSPTNQEGMR